MKAAGAPWRARIPLLVVLLGMAAVVLGQADLQAVADHFRQSRYAEARRSLGLLPESIEEPAETQIWRQRLASDPRQAADLALASARDRTLDPQLKLQACLDGASLALAADQPDAAWRLLRPILERPDAGLPGEAYLLAGRTLRLAGDRQRAREMLASVRPEDPAFAAARNLLGRIGLEQGEHELALHYFESTERRLPEGDQLDLLAGRWQALRLLGRDLEARDLAAGLLRDHPASLAALELRELLRREAQELRTAASAPQQPPDEPGAGPDEGPAGRFTVQLAAFRDRTLALQFVSRWSAEVPGLRVVRQQDDLGQPLHRIQVGSFISRVQAETERNRLQRRYGLDGFVAESGD